MTLLVLTESDNARVVITFLSYDVAVIEWITSSHK